MLLAAGLVFGGALFSQVQKNSGGSTDGTAEKKPVDVTMNKMYSDQELARSLGIEEKVQFLVGNVAFHHNGAVIACDSAVRYYSANRIDCFSNVIINKDSTYVYGDRAEYNGDHNLAKVYSPVIKVVDGDAVLYTTNEFSFNTKDNIGTWAGGGVVYQNDNVLESEKGYFFSDLHEMVGVRNVQMKNDSHQIVSDSVRYNTETKVATFYTRTYIWTNQGEMISALWGRYNTQDSAYFFRDRAYILDEFRESWADTIDYNARARDAIFYGNVQIDDNEHDSSAFGDLGHYWGARGETRLTRRPSLLNYDADQGNADTLYMRADTIFMYVRYPSDGRRRDSLGGDGTGVSGADQFAHLKWVDSLSDSVRVALADSLAGVISPLRERIAELRHDADSIMTALYPAPGAETLPAADSPPRPAEDSLTTPEPEKIEPPTVVELRARAAELSAQADSLQTAETYIRPRRDDGGPGTGVADSLARLRADSISRADSLVRIDSIRIANPKEYKKLQKVEAKRAKARKARLAAERREAKFAAKALAREERARLRAERRAAKAAAKAAKIAERRRQAGRVGDDDPIIDSLARADSLGVRDSLLSGLLDSLEKTGSPTPAQDTATTQSDTTFRIFRGWYNVKIWRKDMQAVSDSIVGFSIDSTLHMYRNPILWHADSQVTADSMTIHTAGEQIERAEFFVNPIMGSQVGGGNSRQFNQVKGRRMVSFFSNGELYRHDTYENAQAYYYMQEEEPQPDGSTVMSEALTFLVGTAAKISFMFDSDSLRSIRLYDGVEYTDYPMDQIPSSQPTMMQGFSWKINRKPALEEVFDRQVRPSEREFHEGLPRPEFPIAARIARRREYLIQNRMWADRSDPLPAYATEFRRQRYREEQ